MKHAKVDGHGEIMAYSMWPQRLDEILRKVICTFYMERPIKPDIRHQADVLLCMFESTNAWFSSFAVSKLLFWE